MVVYFSSFVSFLSENRFASICALNFPLYSYNSFLKTSVVLMFAYEQLLFLIKFKFEHISNHVSSGFSHLNTVKCSQILDRNAA